MQKSYYQDNQPKNDIQNQNPNEKYWGMEVNSYVLLMHLSQFAGIIIPYAGLILPIVMWATNKDKNQYIDQNGKNIVNWIISVFIYSIVAGILSFIIIGIPILVLIGICMIIFPIIGAVNANNGIVWKYPLALNLLN